MSGNITAFLASFSLAIAVECLIEGYWLRKHWYRFSQIDQAKMLGPVTNFTAAVLLLVIGAGLTFFAYRQGSLVVMRTALPVGTILMVAVGLISIRRAKHRLNRPSRSYQSEY